VHHRLPQWAVPCGSTTFESAKSVTCFPGGAGLRGPPTGERRLKAARRVNAAIAVFVLLGVAGLLGGLAVAIAQPAFAQLQLPPLLPSPGATPLLPPLLPGLLSPPLPSPAASPTGPAPASSANQAPATRASGADSEANCGAPPPPFPSRKRSGPRNTDKLVAAAQPLVARGVPLDQAMIAISAPFPVAGKANFTDDWGNPRLTPCPHWHQGTDIFANFGTPVIATENGVVNARGYDAVGGQAVWMTGDDRMSFYYAHLQRFSDVLPGQRVTPGTVLGYVGDTGDAMGGPPHLHFSVHPPTRSAYGVVAVGSLGRSLTPYANPKPYLDAWLDSAVIRAPRLVEALGLKVDADPVSARHLASLVSPAELAGFSGTPGTGPFGLPWSRIGIVAAALGVVAIAQSVITVGRTRRIGRRGPAEEAGAPGAWKPSWAIETPPRKGRWRKDHSTATSRTAQPRLERHDYSAPERPPGLR
jgi:murein DD-endopeptidase MepM/ murein hydrolase activator NlpD